MNRGYFKTWRKITGSAVFQNEGLLKVFIWCLARAAYRETFVMVRTGRGVTEVKLFAGSFLFGRDSAAKELSMSPSTTWKRMLKLKKLEILNIESNSHYSVITIINWSLYQSDDDKSNSESDRQGTGKEHKEEYKALKNIKTFSSDSVEIGLSDLLLEKILSRNPGHKKPNIQTWAKDIDRMIRLDHRTPEEIRTVIEWCQADTTFWQNVILSTGNLRKNFDQIWLKMKGSARHAAPGATPPPPLICPRCGRELVVRNDLYGAGCIHCQRVMEARA